MQWQRDNYLVGTEYADWRRKDRKRTPPESPTGSGSVAVVGSSNSVIRSYEIPWDPTALSHPQLTQLARDFIPTRTVVQALTPVVAGLFVTANNPAPLYDPVRNATIDLIQGQQSNLESVIQNQLRQFLNNPQNRKFVKTSTQGMLVRRSQTTTTTATFPIEKEMPP